MKSFKVIFRIVAASAYTALVILTWNRRLGDILLHKITMVVFMAGVALIYFFTLRLLSAVTAGRRDRA